MNRTGVMAPPLLHELPPQPGLMAHDPAAEPHQLNLSSLFWCVAFVLATVEIAVKHAA
jgi:hypothetical protein